MFYCYELHPENGSAWRSRTSINRINSPAPYRSDQRGKRWRARRDSNPQHAVLETAALPIGATDPKLAGRAGFEPAHLLLNRQAPYRLAIDQKWWVMEESNFVPRGSWVTASRETISPYVISPVRRQACTICVRLPTTTLFWIGVSHPAS